MAGQLPLMGDDQQHRQARLRAELNVLRELLAGTGFAPDDRLSGMEIELNLVTAQLRPAMRNAEALAAIGDSRYQTELARYNLELNLDPRPLQDDGLAGMAADLQASLDRADQRCRALGTRLVMIGMLPTVGDDTFTGGWLSSGTRYRALNESLFPSSVERAPIQIQGPTGESVHYQAVSLAPESACTSVQLHLQLRPDDFAGHWNAAQLLAGPQLAAGANSPFFLGRDLWAETRIEVFRQTLDPGPAGSSGRLRRSRVLFGRNWIGSVLDLFAENVQDFPVLTNLPGPADSRGKPTADTVPRLTELMLHNGTIYRWNRPVYEVANGLPHLRIENRVLPAGPTVIDMVANAAFYYGAVTALAELSPPVWTGLAFEAAARNFQAGARDGLAATFEWPGTPGIPADRLILDVLLPLAAAGLARLKVATDVAENLLGVIEQRCRRRMNGTIWQRMALQRFERRGFSRHGALTELTRAYLAQMSGGGPVHSWELPD